MIPTKKHNVPITTCVIPNEKKETVDTLINLIRELIICFHDGQCDV